MADQSTLKALRNKLSDLEDELDTAHEAQAELEKQLGQLKSDLEAKEEKLQSALTEAKDASERCASSEARLQKLSEAQDAPAEASSPPDSADQSEEVARLRAELQELQRSLKTSQMETKKLEEELKTAEQQQKEAVQQEKKRAEGLTSEIQQLQRSQQETAQAEAQKLKAVEAEYRNECQRLQQLCQELESDRDTALERMQRAEETLKQQMQQFQEFSKKNAAEARAGVEAMGKELEARNARIAQQQAELQRQAQAMAEEQRKAQELQEQLTAYVGTHQVGYTQIHLRRASSAEASFVGCHGFQGECEVQEVWMETLDHLLLGDVPPVDLLKIHVQGSELDVLRGAREALRQGRICVTYVMTHAARIGQFEEVSSEEVVKAYLEIFSNHSVVASDGLTLGIPLQAVPAALKEEDKNYFVIAWHEGRLCRERPSVQAARELFGEVLAAKKWCQLQFSIGHSKYLKHLEETSTAYPLHQDAKLLEVHEQFADAAF